MNYRNIQASDPEVYGAMMRELRRQRDHIELIASENFVSEAVMEAMGSHLTNKYAEGYPGARYYGGCDYVDEVERIAIDRAKRLYGAEHVNVQPHAGSQANMAVYVALLQPGDTILGMSLSDGGHLTHGSKASVSGKYYHAESYGVSRETERIDYDAVAEKAEQVRPKLIIAGASAYPRFIDFKRMREIADSVGAYLMVDMAHIAGLIAAGVHPSPVPYAHVVTTTTHKTLRGPRGAMILCKEELAKKIDSAVFPGTYTGRPADARDRGQGRGPERSADACVPAVSGTGREECRRPCRRPAGRGHPPGYRRNRQPSDAGGRHGAGQDRL